MTTLANSSPMPAITLRSHPLVVIGAWTFRITSAFVAHIRHRRAIRALHQLDDHMLDDIGLVREEIESVVRNGRRGATPII